MLLDYFDSYTTAAVHCARERAGGWLRAVGTFHEKGKRGPPEIIHCNGWWPKQDNCRHERRLTEFCFLYWPYATYRRGPMVDRRLADAEMRIEETNFSAYIEMECGSHGRKRFQRRVRKFKKCTIGVYFVVSDKNGNSNDRKKVIKDWWLGAFLKAPAVGHFATLEEVEADPHGFVWDHWNGKEWEQSSILDPEPIDDSVQVENAEVGQEPALEE